MAENTEQEKRGRPEKSIAPLTIIVQAGEVDSTETQAAASSALSVRPSNLSTEPDASDDMDHVTRRKRCRVAVQFERAKLEVAEKKAEEKAQQEDKDERLRSYFEGGAPFVARVRQP